MAEKRSERLPCVYDVVNGLEIDIDDARLPPLREPDRPGPSSSHHLGKSTSSTPLSHKHEPIQSGLDPNWGTAGGDALPFHSRGESSSSSAVRKKEESESSHEKTTCHICQKTFKRPSDVNKHVKSVHCEKKEFVCSVCKREFARKDYCQRHEESRHGVIHPPTEYQLTRIRNAEKRREQERRTPRRDQGQ